MEMPTLYQYVKLGTHLEYLRGIASVSIIPATSLVEFPSVMNNQPETRFGVVKVVETIRAMLLQLESLKLKETLLAAAPIVPMVEEMEKALERQPDKYVVTLQDHFAERLVQQARIIGLALKQETSVAAH